MELAYEQEAKLIEEMIDYARQGHRVCLLGNGQSMWPLLVDGRDYIFLESVENDTELIRGDVVLYQVNGRYILHRIYRVTEKGYEMLGDGNVMIEPPLPREQIFLKAVAYERKGKRVSADAWQLQVYAKVWMRMRKVRPWIRRGIRFLKGERKREN